MAEVDHIKSQAASAYATGPYTRGTHFITPSSDPVDPGQTHSRSIKLHESPRNSTLLHAALNCST